MHTLAETYDVALVDLDGVVYVGPDAVDHAAAALAQARRAGMRLAFVTNNAARPPSEVAAHLGRLGISADADEVITSAQAAARVLAAALPPGARVLVVGGEGLVAALGEHGLTPVSSADADPVAVVSGFHPDVGWRLLAEGAFAVATGVPWVASNTDRTLPTPRGVAPGNGTLVDAIRSATGRDPVVAGKPEIPMHEEMVLRTEARHPLVVGDRLDTDIEGARRAGVDSLLVLTGVTGPAQLVTAARRHRPTFLGEDLRALAEPPDTLAVAPGLVEHGGFSATVERGTIVVQRSPARADGRFVDAVRTICGAAWAAADNGDRVAGVDAALAAAARIADAAAARPDDGDDVLA
ncbi:MAG TPA: HAD-IIA family hydrolase [Jiangellaceae bacterium]|nr:HAD-IIA family hydrolase [Jiangellaceae bacterium]